MTKPKFCKGCNFFKKNDNICSYYDSNTYPDTSACSKYKGEEAEDDEGEDLSVNQSFTANSADGVKQDVKLETNEPLIVSTVSADNESVLYDKDENNSNSTGNADNVIVSKNKVLESGTQGISETLTTNNSKEVHTSNPYTSKKEPFTPAGMFSHPFSFNGRIRRTEYGLSLIIYYIVYLLVALLTGVVFGSSINDSDGEMRADLFFFILMIPAYLFLLAQGAKRCHDKNCSGWYQIIPFFVLWMIFSDGDPEENDYGMPPKAFYHGKRVVLNKDVKENIEDKNRAQNQAIQDNKEDLKEYPNINSISNKPTTNNSINTGSETTPSNNGKDYSMPQIIIGGIMVLVLMIVVILYVNRNRNRDLPQENDIATDTMAVDSIDEASMVLDANDSLPDSSTNDYVEPSESSYEKNNASDSYESNEYNSSENNDNYSTDYNQEESEEPADYEYSSY